jgi:hypothetical protein
MKVMVQYMREIVVLVVVLLSFSGGNPESSVRDPHSCTIFTVSMGEEVFFASNEDYTNPNTRYWSVASGEGTYGGVYFGFDDLWPQGGVNEVGLAFDINALPETPLNPHPELPPLDDYEGYLVLSTCATVEEAIELVKGYNWGRRCGGRSISPMRPEMRSWSARGRVGNSHSPGRGGGTASWCPPTSIWRHTAGTRGGGSARGTIGPCRCLRG